MHLDTKTWRATLEHAYPHSPPVLTTSMGSVEILRDHNVFVGWGGAHGFSEFERSGKAIFSGSFRSPVDTYRAYRVVGFVGKPLSPPAIAVRKSSRRGVEKVYASWNGSTLVARWRLLAGATKASLHAVKTVRWASFETTIKAAKAHYFEVQALKGRGHSLAHGTSRVVPGA